MSRTSGACWPTALRTATRPARFVPPACPRSPRRSRCIGLTSWPALPCPTAPEFDEWQFFQAESLRRDLAAALERLVRGHSSQGELEPAIPYARRWLALDPLHEPAQRCLMQLYAQAGQRAAALRQYEECQRLLAAELGGSPEQETTALYEAIKARKIAERGVRMDDRTPLSDPAPPSTLPLPPFLSAAPQQLGPAAPFVAREQELAELAAALATARTGAGQILFVIGGAGRGKTMLVQEFARQAQAADAELLVVSGYWQRPHRHWRSVSALSRSVDYADRRGRSQVGRRAHQRRARPAFVGSDAADATGAGRACPRPDRQFCAGQRLARAGRDLCHRDAPWFKQLAALTGADAGAKLEQQRIFAQYTAALKAIASQRPLLLILEDLHWVDSASSGLLFHLSREVGDSRMLIVGTYRPDEVALSSRRDGRHPLADIVSELKRWHGDIWLDLGDLAPVEGRHFVEAYLDTPAQSARRSLSGGVVRADRGTCLVYGGVAAGDAGTGGFAPG